MRRGEPCPDLRVGRAGRSKKAPVRPGGIQKGKANKGEMEERDGSPEKPSPGAGGVHSEVPEVQVQLQPLTWGQKAAA